MKTKIGQSLIEFALILPLFLAMVLGIFDLGRAIFYYSTIHNAAREGARYGAVSHCDTAGIISETQRLAVGLSDPMTVSVGTFFNPDGRPEQIIVTTTFTFNAITPFVGLIIGNDGSIVLSSQARGYIEQPTTCP
jgi:hypothetical protein